jgi:hypothetical protein
VVDISSSSCRVHIRNEGKEVITFLDMHSKLKKNKNGSFGPGVIGNQAFVKKTLGLTEVRKDLVHLLSKAFAGSYSRFFFN